MSVVLAEGIVEVTADGTRIPRQIASDIDRNQGPLEESGRRSSGLFQNVFKGSFFGSWLGSMASELTGQIGYAIGSGLRQAVEFGIGAIDLAGSLQQSIGAVDAVFGSSAGAIHDWASGAAQNVGLTSNAYNELATVLGSQLKNGGTAIEDVAGKTGDLIGLGADMSAMFGGTTKDAVGALSAALRGERDTIERYGVSMTQAAVDAKAMELGLWDGTGAMSQQASQAATLALVYDQTRAAQGMFAAEGDTLAGQQQRLAASFEEAQTKLGTALLPAMTSLATMANETLVPMLDDLIEKVGPQLGQALADAAPAFVGMVEAIVPHIPAFLQLAQEAIPAILEGLGYWVPVIMEIIGSFALGAEQIGTFFGAVFGWFQDMSNRLATGQEQVFGFFAAVGESFMTGMGQIGGFFAGIFGWFGEMGGKLAEGAGQIASFIGDFGARLSEGAGQIGQFVGVVGEKIGEAIAFIGSLPGEAMSALGDLGSYLYDSGSALIGGFIDGISDMVGDVAGAVGDVLSAAADLFPNSPAKRGPFSGAGWTRLGRSGAAIAEQFQSGINASDFSIPFTSTASAAIGRFGAGSSGSMTGAPSAGREGGLTMNVTVNEATDPLGTTGRIGAEMRRWGKK